MIKKINTFYFSATGTTEKIVKEIACRMAQGGNFEQEIKNIDFTLPEARENQYDFSEEDVIVAGVPVIAGRVPNVLLTFLNSVRGNGAKAVCVVMYGNRNYDDALVELKDIMESDGFQVIAGGAFVGEHSFSDVLAGGRPDEKDLAAAEKFADMITAKIEKNETTPTEVNGMSPYRDYYKPKDRSGNFVDFRKITPKTNSTCIKCGICADKCPMGSIDFEDVSKLNGICIKCCACIKKCPQRAKYFDDTNFLKHKFELENEYAKRREPELFV